MSTDNQKTLFPSDIADFTKKGVTGACCNFIRDCVERGVMPPEIMENDIPSELEGAITGLALALISLRNDVDVEEDLITYLEALKRLAYPGCMPLDLGPDVRFEVTSS